MIKMEFSIFLKKINKPHNLNTRNEFEWFCESLGLSTGRDIENTSRKIIVRLVENRNRFEGISTEDIAKDLNIPVSRVNHHLRNLIKTGFIYRKNKKIYFRGGSLRSAIEEMRRDAERIFEDLENMAKYFEQKY
jgi:predicted transcriptional regulator